MAITSWTDNGMKFPLEINQPILTSHINAVRNAYQERALAQSKFNSFGSFLFEVVAGQPITFLRIAPFSNLIEQIEQARNAFINIDTGRQWNQNTIGTDGDTLEPWNETTMLADMGIPSFEVPSRDGHVTVKWINEQYEFINRIVWTNPNIGGYAGDVDDFFRQADGNPFSTAVTNFNATSFASTGAGNTPGHWNENLGGGGYRIRRDKREYNFFDLYNANSTEHETSVHAVFGKVAELGSPLDEYENNDYSVTEGTWDTIETQIATSVQTKTIEVGNFGDNTSTAGVAVNDKRGWYNREDYIKFVLEYDIPTGFKFQFP